MGDATPVIFKREPGGTVLAVFPREPGNLNAHTCACYAHVGQHSYGSALYMASLPPATPAEYVDLKRELEAPPYGYRFKVRKRMTQADYQARLAEITSVRA